MNPNRVKINVTQKCIARGMPGEGDRCPIALAVVEAGIAPIVDVWDCSIRLRGEEQETWLGAASLPAKARKFIYDFDTQKPVKPFTFWVTFAEECK